MRAREGVDNSSAVVAAGPRSGADATRAAILNAALESFARQGYEATTMRNVADEVGIQAASLYNHFTSKSELLWELTQLAITELERYRQASFDAAGITDLGADPVESLRAFVRAHVTYHGEHSRDATLVSAHFSSMTPEQYDYLARCRRKHEDTLQGILEAGCRSRVFSVDDLQLTTYAILAMGAHIAVWYSPSGRHSLDVLSSTYQDLALRLVTPQGAPRAGSPA